MKYLLGISLMLLLSPVSYGNIFAQWGIASSHPGTKNKTDVKFIEFGRSGEVGKLAYTVGAGGWTDNTGYVSTANGWRYTASSSEFVETLLGVEPKSEHFYMTYKLGPAIITNTDALLGSNIQVAHEFGFGMRDVRDVRVGLVIKHFSNAGLVKPNVGRDFLGIRIEF
jgi:hypothetical protein